jgi:hypothetical protein
LGAAAEESAPGEGKGSSTFTSKLSSNLGELVSVVYMFNFFYHEKHSKLLKREDLNAKA